MSDDARPGCDAPAAAREPGAVRPAGFVAVASATPDAAPEALDRLRRAGIAAHLEAGAPAAGGVLFVEPADAPDARIVLATLDAGIGPAEAAVASPAAGAGGAGPARSVDDEFAALVAGLDFGPSWATGSGRGAVLDPEPAEPEDDRGAADSRAADAVSRRLRDEQDVDPPELREEHYEPPAPPPIPRPGGLALAGLAIILAGLAVLRFGPALGLAPDRTLPTGILVILAGAALLAARLKRHRDDSDDDGAVL